MKKQLLLVCPMLLASTAVWGASMCTSQQLSVYDASGFSCAIGGITFSNFGFTYAGNVNPAITDSMITVNPSTDSNGDGVLEFSGDIAAPGGEALSLNIMYEAAAASAIMTDEELAMAGYGTSGNGAVSIGESVCLGGTMDVTGFCGGTNEVSLNVYDNANGSKSQDSATFSAVSVLSVDKNVVVQGGTGSSDATVSEVFNTTSVIGGGGTTGGGEVPEPGSLLMLGSGLIVTALVLRRRCHGA